ADTFALSGEPMPVAENVILEPNFGIGGFSAGPGGLLAYHSGRDVGTRLTWISADGQQLETIGTADNYVQFTLSPDR
ncbi:MAG: hypothetical protein GWN02_13000, partial [Gemmatimonadetes bacterium]|nr:hypothetical protein [Gemmatimonadota bacterium]NIY09140.1 hypothetical protein [Gemmatimonadota bacterium]